MKNKLISVFWRLHEIKEDVILFVGGIFRSGKCMGRDMSHAAYMQISRFRKTIYIFVENCRVTLKEMPN